MDAEPRSDARTGLLLHREEMLCGVLYSGPLRRAVLPSSARGLGFVMVSQKSVHRGGLSAEQSAGGPRTVVVLLRCSHSVLP